jgi:hypothetical protein
MVAWYRGLKTEWRSNEYQRLQTNWVPDHTDHSGPGYSGRRHLPSYGSIAMASSRLRDRVRARREREAALEALIDSRRGNETIATLIATRDAALGALHDAGVVKAGCEAVAAEADLALQKAVENIRP